MQNDIKPHKYSFIMIPLFGKISPDLHAGLIYFYDSVIPLTKAYERKETVLPLLMEAHSHIVAGEPTDAKKWVIPPDFQARFCTPMTMIGMSPLMGMTKRKRSRSPPSRRIAKSGEASINNSSVICELSNKGSCSWTGCGRTRKCKGCGSKEYGMSNCTEARILL